MAQWIKKGDRVLVLAGNDKGRIGTVLRCDRHGRVVVQGINVKKKHVKRQAQVSTPNIEIEVPIHRSNVSLCNDEGQKVRVVVRSTPDRKELVQVDKKGAEHPLRTLRKFSTKEM